VGNSVLCCLAGIGGLVSVGSAHSLGVGEWVIPTGYKTKEGRRQSHSQE
jgi:hypothetical protein